MLTVLLLDDSPDLQAVLKEVIELLGYSVIAVDNGRAGLDVLETSAKVPDIVICDIHMPDMDGFTFLSSLRENPTWADLFFVAMSGRKEDRQPALERGADDYLPKPFNVVDLRASLAKFQSRRSASHDESHQNPHHS